MASIANIVLNDSTPVARTFEPHVKDGLVASWRSSHTARPALYPSISVGMRPEKGEVSRKVTIKVSVPFDVVVGSLTQVRQVSAFIEMIVPTEASLTQIRDAVAFSGGAIINAIIKDTVELGNFPH